MKLVKKCVIALLAIALIFSTSVCVCIVYFAKAAHPEKSDVIIVLGCQVVGSSPSWSLLYRLEKALELYNAGYAPAIIVSGGQGSDEIAAEASIMKKWFIEKGIPEKAIIEEASSTSTIENLKYSNNIMKSKGMHTAVIVTNDFHVFRSCLTAKKLEMESSAAAAKSVGYLRPYLIVREVLSVCKFILLA